MDEIMEWLARIEAKLDELLRALAEEQEEPAQRTLDGEPAGRARDEGQAL